MFLDFLISCVLIEDDSLSVLFVILGSLSRNFEAATFAYSFEFIRQSILT